ncbi:MAG: hypothetical protein QME81_04020, partial [bacterium]|nr:hypothetical protein [bacterium]
MNHAGFWIGRQSIESTEGSSQAQAIDRDRGLSGGCSEFRQIGVTVQLQLYTITPQHLRCPRECYDCG